MKKPAALIGVPGRANHLRFAHPHLVHDSSRVYSPSFRASECGNGSGMRSALEHMKLDQGGTSAVEYAMVAFFVSIAAFTAIVTIGTDVTGLFSRIASSF